MLIRLCNIQLILFLALVLPACAFAHEGEHGEQKPSYKVEDEYLPTPRPDRVCLTWSSDPRSSVDVTYRTDTSVSTTLAEIAPAAAFRGNLRSGDVPEARRVEGNFVQFESDAGTSHYHSVHVSDLKPDTMHAYRVGDGIHWSEWHQFRTAADSDKEFTFVYFGDAQNAIRSMWSRVIREANQHAPRAAFMLHAGDLVNSSNVDLEWGEWFEAGGWINGMIPVVASPGNHEYRGGAISRHWRPQFEFPLNGPAGLEESVYWFDYQGARIISLNSNEGIEQQTAWLKTLLESEDRPKWTIVTFHHPIFSAANDRDNPELRAAWRPLFEKYRVDLVLQGHDHAYNRSGLGGPKNSDNVPEGVRRRDSNTVYVVSVSGPKMYDLQKKWEVPRVASGVQLFQVIKVSKQRIEYEARLASGELYDAFTLTRADDGTNQFVGRIPEMSEIRE